MIPAAATAAGKRKAVPHLLPALALLGLGFVAGWLLNRGDDAPAAGGVVRVRAVTVLGRDGKPSASPDGRMIAFVRVRSVEGRQTGRLGIADAQRGTDPLRIGTGPVRCALQPGRQPCRGHGGVSHRKRPDSRLVMVDVESGAAERVEPGETRSAISLAAWNGNGRELVLARAGSIVGVEPSYWVMLAENVPGIEPRPR